MSNAKGFYLFELDFVLYPCDEIQEDIVALFKKRITDYCWTLVQDGQVVNLAEKGLPKRTYAVDTTDATTVRSLNLLKKFLDKKLTPQERLVWKLELICQQFDESDTFGFIDSSDKTYLHRFEQAWKTERANFKPLMEAIAAEYKI